MRRRQAVLMYLIEGMSKKGGKISKTLLDKQLFLLKHEYGMEKHVKFYNFFPHKFGPYSIGFEQDLADLQRRGFIGTNFKPLGNTASLTSKLTKEQKHISDDVLIRFSNRKEITDYVYARYPKYAVKSELITHKNQIAEPGIFSIGYEGRDADAFLDILIQNNIDTVVDVRYNPFSMKFQFIGSKLKTLLERVGIDYVHLPKLGIEGEKRKNLDSKEEYDKLFKEYAQKVDEKLTDEVKKLATMGSKKRIVLLCFESKHTMCHRGILSEKIEAIAGKTVTHL